MPTTAETGEAVAVRPVAALVWSGIGLGFSYLLLLFAEFGDAIARTTLIGLLVASYLLALGVISASKGRRIWTLACPPFIAGLAFTALALANLVGHDLMSGDGMAAYCKDAGGAFRKAPSAPVHSIALNWDSAEPPPYTTFQYIHPGDAHVRGLSGGVVELGAQIRGIDFWERRGDIGRPFRSIDEIQPFIRVKGGDLSARWEGIPAATADVEVMVHAEPNKELMKPRSAQGPVHVEVVVTDRRTAEQLATLVYGVDASRQRGCGATGSQTLNVAAFVNEAIGPPAVAR